MSVEIFDSGLLPPDPAFDAFRLNPPDTCLIAGASRCGVWLTRPDDESERYGLIGHYVADNSEQSKVLLARACDLLRDKGCATVYGPINGSTWQAYRFVTWSDGSPPFVMEPYNPPQWPQYWRQGGFFPCHEYISTLVTDLGYSDPRLEKARIRLKKAGISWRSISLERFEDELRGVYLLALEAFKKNILYTGINQASFLQLYLPFVGRVDRRYVMVAQDGADSCCGFVFALPDLLQVQAGQKIDRLIIKTLAVKPQRQYAGLGAVLVDEVHKRARENGLNTAIHALMYAGNVSTNIGKNNTIFRRYTLFAKALA